MQVNQRMPKGFTGGKLIMTNDTNDSMMTPELRKYLWDIRLAASRQETAPAYIECLIKSVLYDLMPFKEKCDRVAFAKNLLEGIEGHVSGAQALHQLLIDFYKATTQEDN